MLGQCYKLFKLWYQLYIFKGYCQKSKFFLQILDKDPAPLFFNPETQKILSSMTRIQLDKVFRKRTVQMNNVSYK